MCVLSEHLELAKSSPQMNDAPGASLTRTAYIFNNAAQDFRKLSTDSSKA
jgi:hypothetical protein